MATNFSGYMVCFVEVAFPQRPNCSTCNVLLECWSVWLLWWYIDTIIIGNWLHCYYGWTWYWSYECNTSKGTKKVSVSVHLCVFLSVRLSVCLHVLYHIFMHMLNSYRWIMTFIFATLFGIPAFVVHVTFYYVHSTTHTVFPGLSVPNLVLFILATVVQVSITWSTLIDHMIKIKIAV